MAIVLFGLLGLGVLTLLIFLGTGELHGLLRDLTGDYYHDAPVKTAPKKQQASPSYVEYQPTPVQLERLKCLEQLAKIEICVLDTEVELLDVMAQTQAVQGE